MEGINIRSLTLVQKEDIPKIFKGKEEITYNVKMGQFVRIKNSAPYWGDLAQITQPLNDKNRVSVQVVSREEQVNKDKKKKKHDSDSESDRS